MDKPVGKTKDAGFQFGLQKTFPVSDQEAWDFMFSDAGLEIWLGDLKRPLSLNEGYITECGIEGYVRVFKPYSHIRMNWKKKGWENTSILQIRTIGKDNGKTTISIHQERLSDADQRVEMKTYWNAKMEAIVQHIEGSSR